MPPIYLMLLSPQALMRPSNCMMKRTGHVHVGAESLGFSSTQLYGSASGFCLFTVSLDV